MSVLAAALGGAATIGATMINRAADKKLSQEQFKVNQEQWNLQNQYNSPSQQVARLKAAGLNPAIAYGGNSSVTGNSDPAPNLDYGDVIASSPVIDPTVASNVFSQLANVTADVDLKRAQTENYQANTARTKKLTNAEYDQLTSVTRYNEALTDVAVKQLDELQNKIQLLDLDIDEKKMLNEILENSKDARIKAYTLENDLTAENIKNVNKQTSVYEETINNLIADTKLKVSQKAVADEQKYNVKQQTYLFQSQMRVLAEQAKVFKQEVKKISADANLSDKEGKYYEMQMLLKLMMSCLSAL